jgi:RHS repeat-associated protein
MSQVLGHFRRVFPATDTTEFFYNDDLGSRRIVVAANGAGKQNDYSYSSWGVLTTNLGSDYLAAFTGKCYDLTGLIYFNARYYDPTTGRFLTEDPSRQGVNWYAYCNNNPVNLTDPDGRDVYNPGRNEFAGFPTRVGEVTGVYGVQGPPLPGASPFHPGIDIAAPVGTPVFSPQSGFAVYDPHMNPTQYGRTAVEVYLGGGEYARFGHIDSAVRPGQYVPAGGQVGTIADPRIGNAGMATGPHVHYELRSGGSAPAPVPAHGDPLFFSTSNSGRAVNPQQTLDNRPSTIPYSERYVERSATTGRLQNAAP